MNLLSISSIGLEFRGSMTELYGFLAIIFFAGFLAAFFLMLWFFPRPAKTLAMAHRKGQDVLILATATGSIKIRRGKSSGQGVYSIKEKGRRTHLHLAPSPAGEPWATKRFGLEKSSCTCWFGHETTPELANPLMLLLFWANRVMNLSPKFAKAIGLKKFFTDLEQYQASFRGTKTKTVNGEEKKVSIIKRIAVILLSPGQILDVTDRLWDTGSINDECRRHEWIGEDRAKKKYNVLVLMILIVALTIVGSILFMVMARAG